MLKIQLGLAAASVFLFVVLQFVWPLKTTGFKRALPKKLWGGLFAALYYYGLPLWWWRYGFQNAMKLLLACVASTALLNVALRMAGWLKVGDIVESFFYSMFLAVPIRAIAGFWLARNDERWVADIATKRHSRPEDPSADT